MFWGQHQHNGNFFTIGTNTGEGFYVCVTVVVVVLDTTADDSKSRFLFSEQVVLLPGVAVAIAITAVDDDAVVPIASFVGIADDATTDAAAATDLNKSCCSI